MARSGHLSGRAGPIATWCRDARRDRLESDEPVERHAPERIAKIPPATIDAAAVTLRPACAGAGVGFDRRDPAGAADGIDAADVAVYRSREFPDDKIADVNPARISATAFPRVSVDRRRERRAADRYGGAPRYRIRGRAKAPHDERGAVRVALGQANGRKV